MIKLNNYKDIVIVKMVMLMYIGSQYLMKKYDEYLLDKGYSIEELVDKASDVLLKYMKKDSYAIICGPGNNGADGLSLAIKLHHMKKSVRIYIFDTLRTSYAFRYYLDKCQQSGIKIEVFDDDIVDGLKEELKDVEVVVVGIFGFGLNNAPTGLLKRVIDEINLLFEHDIISIDVPSGLDCNHGIPMGPVICATQTITFNALKNSFLNLDTRLYTGELIIDFLDIEDVGAEVGLFELYEKKNAFMHLKKRLFNGYKGMYGKAGILAGCEQYKGAALLASKSAVYSGAGLVSLTSHQSVLDSLTSFVPEAISIHENQFYDHEFSAVLAGCGIGLNQESYHKIENIFNNFQVPLVIDGDGLTILSEHLELLKDYKSSVILTPHIGEFKRLIHSEDIDDPLMLAKNFALDYKCTVVLKGPLTIVTDGYESYRIHSGNKAMATAGMGDVLAGLIVGLLAQGYSPIIAASLGTYIHGYCGDKLAKEAYTVIPSRLIEQIPTVMKELLDR